MTPEDDTPKLSSSTAYTASSTWAGNGIATINNTSPANLGYFCRDLTSYQDYTNSDQNIMQKYQAISALQSRNTKPTAYIVQKEDDDMAEPKLRIVRIMLVDKDENIPIDRRLLHKTDEVLTDSTDQELVHEVPVKELLAKHNEYRTGLKDKEVKEKDAFLEPVRMRDLVLSIVTVASF